MANGCFALGMNGCRDDGAMKTPKTVSLSILFVSVLLLVSQCHGQSNVVYYGANASPSFVDPNLSMSAKTSIVADLRICLSEWGKAAQFRLGADDPAFVAHLYNPDTTPYYPETIDFP